MGGNNIKRALAAAGIDARTHKHNARGNKSECILNLARDPCSSKLTVSGGEMDWWSGHLIPSADRINSLRAWSEPFYELLPPSALIEFQIRPSPSLTHYFYPGLRALSRRLTLTDNITVGCAARPCRYLILFATRSRFMAERQHFSNRFVDARRRFQGAAGWPGRTENIEGV